MEDMESIETYFMLEYALQNNHNWTETESYDLRVKNSQFSENGEFLENREFLENEEFPGDCNICLESTYKQNVYILPCGHVYHKECIYSHILHIRMAKCPDCMIIK